MLRFKIFETSGLYCRKIRKEIKLSYTGKKKKVKKKGKKYSVLSKIKVAS